MTPRVAVIASLTLGLLVAFPVLTVIGLGAYGSSLGGQSGQAGSTEPQLRLNPSSGTPGTAVAVEGKNWPPRSRVNIYVKRTGASDASPSPQVRMGSILASRSGAFTFDAVMPAALVGEGASGLVMLAEAAGAGGEILASRSAQFLTQRHSNSIRALVVDAETGAPLPGSRVVASDDFGQPIARATADGSGATVFSGLKPGMATVTVRHPRYYIGTARLNVPQSGAAVATMPLTPAPPRRLLVPGVYPAGAGRVRVFGIDRWTGLPFDDETAVPSGVPSPAVDRQGSYYFGYLIPQPQDLSDDSAAAADIAGVLWSLARARGLAALNISGTPTVIWVRYLGRSPHGDVLYSTASSTVERSVSRLYILDPKSGQASRQLPAAGAELPVLAADGSAVHLINRLTGTVRTLFLATGEIQLQSRVLPRPVVHAVSAPDHPGTGLLLTVDGSLYTFNMQGDEPPAKLSSYPGSAWIASGRNGTVVLANPSRSELIQVDRTDGGLLGIVRLASPADWVWADAEGPYIYAAAYESDALVVHLVDFETLQPAGALSFPISRQGPSLG